MTPKDETVTQHLGGSTSDKDKPSSPAPAWTPGPWRLGSINYADIYGAQSDGPIALAVKCLPDDSQIQTIANARLIAAAPELYTTLEEMRNVLAECAYDTLGTPTHDFFQSKVRTCDVVLAKARGES